jgi:hypothetical protein
MGNVHHANLHRSRLITLGRMQLLASQNQIDDAKAALQARWKDASENPAGEPTRHRDRYKIWLVVIGFLLLSFSVVALSTAHTLRPDMNMQACRFSAARFAQ